MLLKMLLIKTRFSYFMLVFVLALGLFVTKHHEAKAGEESESDVEEVIAGLAATKVSRPVVLDRFSEEGCTMVRYTQQLTVQEKKIDLNRESTRAYIEKVMEISKGDGLKTHLFARAFCVTADNICFSMFTAGLEFPNVPLSSKIMDW
ncbi:MAG TPA: hypothetical protein VGU44_01285, partial [Gammaproteobacteria bacterium]|nr:hypothetical protein [Gammaproteobacteria bacterium]